MYPRHQLPQEKVLQDLKGYQWAFGVAAVNAEKIKQLSTLPGLSKDPFIVGLLQVQDL